MPNDEAYKIVDNHIREWYEQLPEYWQIRFMEKSGSLMETAVPSVRNDRAAYQIIKDEMSRETK